MAALITIEILSRKGKVKIEPVAAAVVAPVVEAAISEPQPEMVELESPDLPQAPTSPAVAPSAPAPQPRGARKPYGPRDGDEYSERHDRRLKTGK